MACHSPGCRPPTSGGSGGSLPGGSQSAAYMAMKRRDAQQQATIATNKYRAGVGMSQLPVTESDRMAPAPKETVRGTGRTVAQVKNVGKVRARLMPNSLLAHLYPMSTGEARRSIKAEMSRRGVSHKSLSEKSKIAS